MTIHETDITIKWELLCSNIPDVFVVNVSNTSGLGESETQL
jgi:hypothetical protein